MNRKSPERKYNRKPKTEYPIKQRPSGLNTFSINISRKTVQFLCCNFSSHLSGIDPRTGSQTLVPCMKLLQVPSVEACLIF